MDLEGKESSIVWVSDDPTEIDEMIVALLKEWPKLVMSTSSDQRIVMVENLQPPFGGQVIHAFCSGFSAGRKSR